MMAATPRAKRTLLACAERYAEVDELRRHRR
jgi:hypothetical protein